MLFRCSAFILAATLSLSGASSHGSSSSGCRSGCVVSMTLDRAQETARTEPVRTKDMVGVYVKIDGKSVRPAKEATRRFTYLHNGTVVEVTAERKRAPLVIRAATVRSKPVKVRVRVVAVAP